MEISLSSVIRGMLEGGTDIPSHNIHIYIEKRSSVPIAMGYKTSEALRKHFEPFGKRSSMPLLPLVPRFCEFSEW